MSHLIDPKYRVPNEYVAPEEDKSSCLSWKLITVIALLALGSVAVGVMTLLSSQYPALSGLKVLGFAGGAAFTGAGGLLFVITLIGIGCKCTEDEPPSSRPVNYYTDPKIQLLDPFQRLAERDSSYAYSPDTSTVSWEVPKAQEREGVSSVALVHYQSGFCRGFYLAIESALDQKTNSEFAPYLANQKSLGFQTEDFLGRYAISMNPRWPIPDFNKLARLFVMSNQEVLNLSCKEVAAFDPYQLVMIHARLEIMENSRETSIQTEHALDFDPQGNLGHLRGLSINWFSTANFSQIPKLLLSMLSAQQIDAILRTRGGLDSPFINLLLPVRKPEEIPQNAIQRRRIMNLNSLSNHALKKEMDFLGPQLDDLYDVKFQSPDFPWTTFIATPQSAQAVFSLEGTKTKKRLECLDIKVIKQLLPILSAKHLRLLSDRQLKSKDFPVEELVKDSAKAAAFLDISSAMYRFRTADILHAMDPQVMHKFGPVLTGKHLALLSPVQKSSEYLPIDHILGDPEQLNDFLPDHRGINDTRFKRFFDSLDRTVQLKLIPVLSDSQKMVAGVVSSAPFN